MTKDEVEAIDEGIRERVLFLQGKGFHTTDSDDGTKVGKMACALPYPHIFVVCAPHALRATADDLAAVLEEHGLGGEVEASYRPSDNKGIVMVAWPDESPDIKRGAPLGTRERVMEELKLIQKLGSRADLNSAMIVVRDYTARHGISCINQWLRLRENEGKPVGGSYVSGRAHSLASSFMIEADHSARGGLLGWLLDGNEPLPHPPPLSYSRPWHRLIESGVVTGSFAVYRSRWSDRPRLVINQYPWDLVEELGDHDYRIAYHDLDTWRLTRSPGDEGKPVPIPKMEWIWTLKKERRPPRALAEQKVRALLLDEVEGWSDDAEISAFCEDGSEDYDSCAKGKCGWAFAVTSTDTTSYVHENLDVEWYGTNWTPDVDQD